jgi:hypothetical protein
MAEHYPTFTPEELANEIWKPCENSPFEISSIGRVRNNRTGVLRKQSFSRKGYPVITLWLDGKQNTYTIHRLVAIHFIGLPPIDRNQVNHKDGNKLNNRVDNLEWVNQQENMNHAKKLGLIASGDRSGHRKHPERFPRTFGDSNGMRLHPESVLRGESNGNSKLTDEVVKAIRREYIPRKVSQRTLAKKYNVSQRLILMILQGEIWQHVE